MGNVIKNLAQAKTSQIFKKPAGDEPIINNNSKQKYPRIGKMDREGQILEDGKVETFVTRTKKVQNPACKATERLREIKHER